MRIMRFPMNYLLVFPQTTFNRINNTPQNPCKYWVHTKKAKKKYLKLSKKEILWKKHWYQRKIDRANTVKQSVIELVTEGQWHDCCGKKKIPYTFWVLSRQLLERTSHMLTSSSCSLSAILTTLLACPFIKQTLTFASVWSMLTSNSELLNFKDTRSCALFLTLTLILVVTPL